MNKTKILYPTNIDRWTKPVATKLREISIRNSTFTFYAFSSPLNKEDIRKGKDYWSKSHIQKITPGDLLYRKYDITHITSSTFKIITASYLAKLRNNSNKLLLTVPTELRKGEKYFRLLSYSIKQADKIVAISDAVAESISFYTNKDIDAVIGNGVDLNFFSRALANDIPAKFLQKPFFLFVGYLTKGKRPDFFLRIAKQLPQYHFVMIGGYYTEKERDHFLNKINSLSNVTYTGLQPRQIVRDYMAKASALIFPSEYEGMPSTVLEASAMGLPVLAQPVSSLPEVIHSDVNGWLISIKQVDDWISKLNEVLGWSSDEQKKFQLRARNWVSEHFSWDRVAEQYGNLYKSIS